MSQPVFALSTWSIHRAIGVSYPDAPGDPGRGVAEPTWGAGTINLTDVPARIAALGINRLEICSFHINRHDEAFLTDLRAAIDDAGVTLQSVLIDDGDICDPEHGERDAAWIGAWIDVAATLGAESARVIAGKQHPTAQVLDRSATTLGVLAQSGAEKGVRVTTENWFETTPGPDELHALLDRNDGTLGLLADFGNWSGEDKYDNLAAIFPRAEYSHSKCHFDAGMSMDADDYGRCVDAAVAAGYEGPHTLIYEGPDDEEWRGVEMEREFIQARIASAD